MLAFQKKRRKNLIKAKVLITKMKKEILIKGRRYKRN